MFRRLRYRKWLVAGLGLAAFVVPTTALAGNNLGAKDGWYTYAVSLTKQAQSPVLDGRSPDTKDAALAASQRSLDPAIVKYLLRYGFTQGQIAALSGGTYKATNSQPTIDPMVVKYLLRYGYTESQIAATSGGAFHVSQPAVVDGRSPDTIDFATQAHQPVVTVVREPGFQWGDFGIGLSAALLALVAISLTRLFSNRGGRRPVTSS
jgi:hypothetical protein